MPPPAQRCATRCAALVKTWDGVFPAAVVAEAKASLVAQPASVTAAAARPANLVSSARAAMEQPASSSSSSAAAGKRKRDENGSGAGPAADESGGLREEVANLMERIDAHIRVGFPADEQVLGWAARACALYGAILASVPPDNDVIIGKLGEAQQLQKSIKASMEDPSIPLQLPQASVPGGMGFGQPAGPPWAAAAASRRIYGPSSASTASGNVWRGWWRSVWWRSVLDAAAAVCRCTMSTASLMRRRSHRHRLRACTTNKARQGCTTNKDRLRLMTKATRHLLLNRLKEMRPFYAAAASSNGRRTSRRRSRRTASSALRGRVQTLGEPHRCRRAQDRRRGCFEQRRDRMKPPPPAPGPRTQTELLWRLHEMRPLQCKTCGLRFAESQREELRKHMDKHFKRNQVVGQAKQEGSSAPLISRKWMLPLAEWINHAHEPEKEEEEGGTSASVFDALENAEKGTEEKKAAAAGAAVELPKEVAVRAQTQTDTPHTTTHKSISFLTVLLCLCMCVCAAAQGALRRLRDDLFIMRRADRILL